MDDSAYATSPPATSFSIVHVAAMKRQPIQLDASDSLGLASASPSAQQPAVVVLFGLVYLATVVWYLVTSNNRTATTSETYLWVVCIPYTAFMLDKLLNTIRAMEATEQAEYFTPEGLEAGDCESNVSDHVNQDAIAVAGDVYIYVIGTLLQCYLILPTQLYVEW